MSLPGIEQGYFTISDSLNSILEQVPCEQAELIKSMLVERIEYFLEIRESHGGMNLMLMVYAEMDRAINESINADPPIDISCKKGCSFCCHSHVDISTDESELIKLVTSANKIDIDYELLKETI